MELVATGLAFPEGPIAVLGGDVLVAEIQNGDLTRVSPSGNKTVMAQCGGGPNGAALGPDGLSGVDQGDVAGDAGAREIEKRTLTRP